MEAAQELEDDALSTALFVVLVAPAGLVCVPPTGTDMARPARARRGRTVTLLLALCALGGCVMNCVYHRLILSSLYGVPLDAVDWMGVAFVANAVAYVLPMRADLICSAQPTTSAPRGWRMSKASAWRRATWCSA